MAVADVEKVERVDRPEKPEKPVKPAEVKPGDAGPASGLAAAVGWLPRKIAEGRAFLTEVRGELKKVTWPSRKEVYSTTLVVIATSIFFGFYLWGLDLALSRLLSLALKRQM